MSERDVRLVLCEHCGSEGRIYGSRSGHQNDPDTIDRGPCPCCEGTGREMIEVEPITMEDLDARSEQSDALSSRNAARAS